MTRKQIEDERDKLANSYVDDIEDCGASPDECYLAGFNAAVKLMEKHRVKPLREALDEIANDEDTLHFWPVQEVARKALAQVEEWSE